MATLDDEDDRGYWYPEAPWGGWQESQRFENLHCKLANI